MGIFDFLKPSKKKNPTNWREAMKQDGGYTIPNPKRIRALEEFKKLGIKKVKIRSSQDQRVCSDCKKHAGKTYTINQLPKLPICRNCRCYYEPVII